MPQPEYKRLLDHNHLTAEQEIELSKRIIDGDESAIEVLIKHNYQLVFSIAKTYTTTRLTIDDAMNTGVIGLILAAKRYDHTYGARFGTFAAYYIRNELQKAFWEQKGSVVRVPASTMSSIKKAIKDGEKLKPLQEDALTKVQAAHRSAIDVYALPQESQPIVEEPIPPFLQDEIELVLKHLSRLREKDQYILKARYGLPPFKEALTHVQLAKIEGVSREWIRTMEKTALNRLKALIEEG